MVRLGAVDKWIAAGEGAGMAWRAMKGMTLTVGKDRSSFMAAPDARAGVVDVTPPAPPRRIRMLGMPISVVTEPQAVAHVIACLGAGHGGWVITPNLDQLRLYRKDVKLRPMYEEAELIVADGMPLIWASRLQKTPLPEPVAGSSMILT